MRKAVIAWSSSVSRRCHQTCRCRRRRPEPGHDDVPHRSAASSAAAHPKGRSRRLCRALQPPSDRGGRPGGRPPRRPCLRLRAGNSVRRGLQVVLARRLRRSNGRRFGTLAVLDQQTAPPVNLPVELDRDPHHFGRCHDEGGRGNGTVLVGEFHRHSALGGAVVGGMGQFLCMREVPAVLVADMVVDGIWAGQDHLRVIAGVRPVRAVSATSLAVRPGQEPHRRADVVRLTTSAVFRFGARYSLAPACREEAQV